MTYFPKFGFYVSGINGVSEISGETYWELIEHSNGKQHQVGKTSINFTYDPPKVYWGHINSFPNTPC